MRIFLPQLAPPRAGACRMWVSAFIATSVVVVLAVADQHQQIPDARASECSCPCESETTKRGSLLFILHLSAYSKLVMFSLILLLPCVFYPVFGV